MLTDLCFGLEAHTDPHRPTQASTGSHGLCHRLSDLRGLHEGHITLHHGIEHLDDVEDEGVKDGGVDD